MYSDGVVVIDELDTYRVYLDKYRCKNLSDLDETLWYTYGVSLEISKPVKEKIIFFDQNRQTEEKK